MVIRMQGLVITVHEDDVTIRFAKADYPEEIAAVEAAQEQVERAVRVEDRRVHEDAAAAMYESVLALLSAPRQARKRSRGLW